MIKPTTGRVVHFFPYTHSGLGYDAKQPFAAMVTYVHNDRCVNLVIFDQSDNRAPWYEKSVTLLQDDDQPQEVGRYAKWMEYQKGQAAKTEALEAQLGQRGIVPTHNAPLLDEVSSAIAGAGG